MGEPWCFQTNELSTGPHRTKAYWLLGHESLPNEPHLMKIGPKMKLIEREIQSISMSILGYEYCVMRCGLPKMNCFDKIDFRFLEPTRMCAWTDREWDSENRLCPGCLEYFDFRYRSFFASDCLFPRSSPSSKVPGSPQQGGRPGNQGW